MNKTFFTSIFVLAVAGVPIGYYYLGSPQALELAQPKYQTLIKAHRLMQPLLHSLKKQAAQTQIALESDQKNAQKWAHLAEVFCLQKRYEKGIVAFDRAIALEPAQTQWQARRAHIVSLLAKEG